MLRTFERPVGLAFVCLSLVLLGGCCCFDQTKKEPPAPPKQRVIGLAEAIKQVQEAVFEGRQAAEDKKIGVVASKVTFNLKLAAADTDAQGRTVTLGVALGPITAGGGSTDTLTVGDSAESNITLELVNPLLADKDTILGTLVTSAQETPAQGGAAKPIKRALSAAELQKIIEDTVKGTMKMDIAPGG